MAVEQQTILTALQSVLDPNTGKDFGRASKPSNTFSETQTSNQ